MRFARTQLPVKRGFPEAPNDARIDARHPLAPLAVSGGLLLQGSALFLRHASS
jgi:hypothetical protein